MNTEKILEEIRSDVKALNTRFDGIDARLDGVDGSLKGLKEQMEEGFIETHEMIHDFSTHTDKQVKGVQSQMVTKDYLDEKLGSFRGEVIEASREAAIHAVAAR